MRSLVAKSAIGACEAALAQGVPVLAARHLLGVVASLQPGDDAVALPAATPLSHPGAAQWAHGDLGARGRTVS
jgi:hypothetical protein